MAIRTRIPRLIGAMLWLVLATAACDAPLQPSPFAFAPPPALPVPPPQPPAVAPPPPAGVAVRVPTPPLPASPRPLEGRYQLDLELGELAGADCAAVPDEVRNRAFTATVLFTPFVGIRVVLSEAQFLEGEICRDTRASSGEPAVCNVLDLEFNDFATDEVWLDFGRLRPALIEQLPSGAWTALVGAPSGRISQDGIAVTGTVTLSYWFGDPVGSSYVACTARGARLTLSQRQGG